MSLSIGYARRYYVSVVDHLSGVRFELTTSWLRASRSTTELTTSNWDLKISNLWFKFKLTNRDSNAGNLDQNEGGYHYPIGHGIMDCRVLVSLL